MSLQGIAQHDVNKTSTSTATHFPQPLMLEKGEWKMQHWLASMLQEFIMFNSR